VVWLPPSPASFQPVRVINSAGKFATYVWWAAVSTSAKDLQASSQCRWLMHADCKAGVRSERGRGPCRLENCVCNEPGCPTAPCLPCAGLLSRGNDSAGEDGAITAERDQNKGQKRREINMIQLDLLSPAPAHPRREDSSGTRGAGLPWPSLSCSP